MIFNSTDRFYFFFHWTNCIAFLKTEILNFFWRSFTTAVGFNSGFSLSNNGHLNNLIFQQHVFGRFDVGQHTFQVADSNCFLIGRKAFIFQWCLTAAAVNLRKIWEIFLSCCLFISTWWLMIVQTFSISCSVMICTLHRGPLSVSNWNGKLLTFYAYCITLFHRCIQT